MKNNELETKNELREESLFEKTVGRRSFLQYAGAGAAGIALVAAGCKKDRGYPDMNTGATLDFKDDFGVLNYAYALEQLEAAFYVKVASAPPASFTTAQKAYFQDIQFHEIAHREFFKAALGTAAIGSLEVDFSSIDFTSSTSVLGAAMAFEDLGVSAYNGAGPRIKNGTYLLLAGKIVSVEARHAAYIRDLISNGSFADLNSLAPLGANNAGGLDAALTPDKVLAIAGKYIKTKINVVNL
ncbi:ferritin-like domain-containing protein [Pedobacter sp. HDW13]|uniref:ferritin-like domain-containing protein n=1 Tax=unclassified Pedobacter TaxID=2628915 RepID=UPI000F592B0F|nr:MULTISPECIES: ferritin-like domain-containing protein [unclassified Pedobacter]QIL42440.1 ferritin-like domain-containing protein [Pedobacter sp. HDW13]RQO78920.1 Tat (twin-arginine translocation) pathway signal sequence containing protein [Pedobacter sp. KBW01]